LDNFTDLTTLHTVWLNHDEGLLSLRFSTIHLKEAFFCDLHLLHVLDTVFDPVSQPVSRFVGYLTCKFGQEVLESLDVDVLSVEIGLHVDVNVLKEGFSLSLDAFFDFQEEILLETLGEFFVTREEET